MSDTAIVQLIGFATLVVTTLAGIITMWVKFHADATNRELDIQERDLQARLASASRESLKREVVKQAEAVQAIVQDSTDSNAAQATLQADKQRLLSDVVELQALDTLHHALQPVFDDLIEKFKTGDISDQELTQFIARLYVIANDESRETAQQPSAKLTLDRALDLARFRNLTAPPHEKKENVAAGEAMRVEAEPQRDKAVDDGEGPASKPKA